MAIQKPRSIKAWAIGAVVLIAVVALAAFQFRGDGSAKAKTVTIAGIAYPFEGRQVYNGLTGVVIRDGWLKAELAKRGVALALTPVPTAVGGPLINEGFSGKRIDFAAYGDFPAIIAVSGGVPLRLVAPTGQGLHSYLVVRNGLAARSIADLKGKRIALHRGRPWELPFSKLIDASGLKQSDFKIVNINPAATPAALASGNVDAAFLLSDGLLLEQKGAGRVIWSTKQAPADWRMRAELFGRGDFVDANPELTQLVVDAYVRAAAWSAQDSNRDRVIKDAARGSMPVEIIARDYANDGIQWRERFSPAFTTELVDHYRSVADYAFERGLVRNKVDVDKLIDRRFVAPALRDAKLEGFWSPTAPAPAQAQAAAPKAS
ncbi:ABC transporter substrate-binding protein [Sphingomonas sp. 7/4-4]|uniref:ABC transporter substrate-binding protein n=1 Tax=Sphingomonas sp. 7/4-4 TaxID=3018446 RepID=UPI0022F396CA|nr:ABC transporter substrate-binding protein [Sphingomonas sp. 7/4-4]WBY09331.1 ABC transporter substrate-binding protein [Sphingomonas sp. 7/4-4]